METFDVAKVRALLTEAREICLDASASAQEANGRAQDALVELRHDIEEGEQRTLRTREILAESGFVLPTAQ